MSCPNCRVSLYRTTSSAEIKLGVNLEYMLALAGFVIAALALFLVGPTPYFWLLFVIGLACAAAAFIRSGSAVPGAESAGGNAFGRAQGLVV